MSKDEEPAEAAEDAEKGGDEGGDEDAPADDAADAKEGTPEPEQDAKPEPEGTPEPGDKKGAKPDPEGDKGWLAPESRKRRIVFALAIYAACVALFMIVAGPPRITQHTPFNHFAHQADAWLHGRQDLRFGEPPYAGGNDFAHFEGKVYISFPPFPAVLMMPMVALAGSPEDFQDGQFVIWLAGVAPAVLFLVLEKLRRTKRSPRSETTNVVLSALFAAGTVYFFTSVQGTVWFAAHVVAAGLLAIYALYALDAERPIAAGAALGCLFLTRPQCLLTGALFALEAVRVTARGGLATEGGLWDRVKATWERVDKPRFWRTILSFAAPIAAALAFGSWLNWTRYHDPSPNAFGHQYLTVVWQARMARWGLFNFHYLSKNLGCFLTILPWLPPKGAAGAPALQINEHGLALWFTTPLYLWLLWPKRRGYLHAALWIAALGPLVFDLFYQNSGWRQFGYRFSNDYSILLFMLLAVGARPFKRLFELAAVWSVAWNLFGAISFDRGAPWDKYYWREGTQKILYQDD